MLDNYTIKKILPRLIIAVIGIQLSFFVAQVLVDFSNVLGSGIQNFFEVTADINTSGASAKLAEAIGSSIGGSAGFGLGIAGILLGLAAVVFFPGLALALAMIVLPFIFTVLATLVARYVVIVLLTILSPIAMLAWVLPNTEKYARQWLSIFVKTLMVYPMITALVSVSAIVSTSIASVIASGEVTGTQDALYAVMGLAAMIIPLAAVPFTFKFAGAALGAISNAVSNTTNRMAAPLKKKGFEYAGSQASRSRRGTRFNNKFLNRAGQIATGRFGITGKGKAKRTSAHYQHTLEGAKHLYEAGVTNENALNAIAEAGGDLDVARDAINASQLSQDQKQEALNQLNIARSIPHMTREGLQTSAIYAASYQGRVSSKALESLNAVEDHNLRSAILRKSQDDAKAAGQLEVKGGSGFRADGTVFGFDSEDGLGVQKLAATAPTLSTGDWQRAKSLTAQRYAAPMVQAMKQQQAILETSHDDLVTQALDTMTAVPGETADQRQARAVAQATAAKDQAKGALGTLFDSAATIGHYLDPAAKNALETELRGDKTLHEGVEVAASFLAPAGATDVKGAVRVSRVGGPAEDEAAIGGGAGTRGPGDPPTMNPNIGNPGIG